jgi:catechol 2,3-dioxygenase-like lactoylglutathione lyase family enzyme
MSPVDSQITFCHTRDLAASARFYDEILGLAPVVDGWYETLRSRGATPEGPPIHSPIYRIYHFFVKDPNGYNVESQRFDDPEWSV